MRHRVRVSHPHNLIVGADSWIGEGVQIDNPGVVHIEDNVVISQAAHLVNSDVVQPLMIEHGAWIALRSTVRGPAKVGRRAVIGAGANISRDVRSDDLVNARSVLRDRDLPTVAYTSED